MERFMSVCLPPSPTTREIFVVDDDLNAREALADLLEHSGYTVFSAANGREALDYLHHSAPPAVIILDLMMPVMDGVEFLHRQSHDPALLDIPVIILTASPPAESVKASAIMRKPVRFDSLLQVVERLSPPH
jgi:CheY-like chemotaxis protein